MADKRRSLLSLLDNNRKDEEVEEEHHKDQEEAEDGNQQTTRKPAAAELGFLEKFSTFIAENKGCQKVEDSKALKEYVCDLSRAELETLWNHLIRVSAAAIDQIDHENNEGASRLDLGLKVVKDILSLISIALRFTDTSSFVPDGLTRTVVEFHVSSSADLLPWIAGYDVDIGKEITGVCEKWWSKNFPRKHLVVSNCLVYLLQLCMTDRGTNAIVRRLWELKDAFLLHSFEETPRMPQMLICKDLRKLMILAPTSKIFVKSDIGKRFLGFLFTFDGFEAPLHASFKEAITVVFKPVAEAYGDVYFRAWKQLEGEKRKSFEESCIQDLLFLAVNVKAESLVQVLKNFFRSFAQKKELKHFDTMIYRQLCPFIWRCLTVPNGNIRKNAAGMFFMMFPLRDTELPAAEAESLFQNQLEAIKEILMDPIPVIRVLGINETSRICCELWDIFPINFRKEFLTSLVKSHAFDINSADSRVAVYQGLKYLISNPATHLPLEKILPRVGKYGINDNAEKVRLSAVNMLLALKGYKTLKFWNVVPLDDILMTLSVEKSARVCRALTNLLLASYCPLHKGLDARLQRTGALIKANFDAARKFYVHIQTFMDMEYSVDQIMLLLRGVYMCVRRTKSANADTDGSSCSSLGDTVLGSEENLAAEGSEATDLELMNGLLDCAGILWFSIAQKLQQNSAHLRPKLYQLVGRVLPSLIQYFDSPRITDSLFSMARLLPSTNVQYLSTHVLKRLEALQDSKTGTKLEKHHKALVQVACVWRLPDLVELVNNWLDSCLNPGQHPRHSNTVASTGQKKNKKKRKVQFRSMEKQPPKPRQGLAYLHTMLEDHSGRSALLEQHAHLLPSICQRLNASKELLGRFLKGENTENLELISWDDLISCLKLLYIIKGIEQRTEEEKNDLFDWIKHEVDWIVTDVLPVILNGLDGGADELAAEQHRIAVDYMITFLIFIRHALMVNLMSFELVTIITDLISQLLTSNSAGYLHTEIAEVIYHLGEWCLHSEDLKKTPEVVVELFKRFLCSLVVRFRSKLIEAPEFVGAVNCAEALRETVISLCFKAPTAVTRATDLVTPLMASSLSDLVGAIRKVDCVEMPCDPDFECPGFSDFILRLTMQKHPQIVGCLAERLTGCVSTGALENGGIVSLGAAAQMIFYLKNAKCRNNALRGAVGAVREQLDSLGDEEKKKEMFSQVQDLLTSLEK